MRKSEIELFFCSQLHFLDMVQDVSETVARLVGLDDDGRYWISLSVRESVTNAILHGNKLDETKRVGVRFSIETGRLRISVEDEGPGFDVEKLPDPLREENLLKPSGRGIFYVRSFMDEVSFRHRPNGGWEMRMEKRLNHKPKSQGETDDH